MLRRGDGGQPLPHMKPLKQSFKKQAIRSKLGIIASYTEIYISFLIIIGIIILSFQIIIDLRDIFEMIASHSEQVHFSRVLATAFELIIGVEFVKMLAKHTPGSAVEVLLFTVARQLIASEGSMLETLFGVIAIALIFAIRKFFGDSVIHAHDDEYIINGGTSTKEINSRIGTNIDPLGGNTIAGLIYNMANRTGDALDVGYEVAIDEFRFEVYSMDSDLIKQVKIYKPS